MFRVNSFLSRKGALTLDEFRDYYENHHVPLVLSIAETPPLYKRRYFSRDEPLMGNGAVADFDVVTELGFADEAAFRAGWMEPLGHSEKSHLIGEDEENFLDRVRTRAYTFDEHVTAG